MIGNLIVVEIAREGIKPIAYLSVFHHALIVVRGYHAIVIPEVGSELVGEELAAAGSFPLLQNIIKNQIWLIIDFFLFHFDILTD